MYLAEGAGHGFFNAPILAAVAYRQYQNQYQ